MDKVKQPHPRLIRLAREVGAVPGEFPRREPAEKRTALDKKLAKVWRILAAGRRFAR